MLLRVLNISEQKIDSRRPKNPRLHNAGTSLTSKKLIDESKFSKNQRKGRNNQLLIAQICVHPWRRFKLASFSITDNGINAISGSQILQYTQCTVYSVQYTTYCTLYSVQYSTLLSSSFLRHQREREGHRRRINTEKRQISSLLFGGQNLYNSLPRQLFSSRTI